MLTGKYNPNVGYWEPPNTVPNTFDGVCAQAVPLYYCPSDRPGAKWTDDAYWRCRGNYVVNWGPITRPWTAVPTARAPFGWRNDNPSTPERITLVGIVDGTSNTLLMAEILMSREDKYGGDGPPWDIRGDVLNDDPYFAAFQFMTINPPNGGVDVNVCQDAGDPRMPCTSGSNLHAAARSRHSGGVNAVFGDGSVRFVPDSIDLNVWRNLSTRDGAEPNTNF